MTSPTITVLAIILIEALMFGAIVAAYKRRAK